MSARNLIYCNVPPKLHSLQTCIACPMQSGDAALLSEREGLAFQLSMEVIVSCSHHSVYSSVGFQHLTLVK